MNRPTNRLSSLFVALLRCVASLACAGLPCCATKHGGTTDPIGVGVTTVTSYRVATVDFMAHLVVDPKVVKPSDMPPLPDVANAVRKKMRSIPGVDSAILDAYTSAPVQAGDEKAASDVFWKLMSKGRDGKSGMTASLTAAQSDGSTVDMTPAYLYSDITGLHIKWGWVMVINSDGSTQPFTTKVKLKYKGVETEFEVFVGVWLSVTPT